MQDKALYLKWRPQLFDEVIGQEHILLTLRHALRQGRVRHAYLFSGPRGTGKTTTARLLAKALNCQREDVEERPCGLCHACVAVSEGRFLDLIEIDAASHTSVDDVRDLRDKIAFAPSEGRYKVYIIDEVHRFSGAAFDALLKTLEEPPAHAIFVLATTELDKVPATIKSRCLLFEFRRVSVRQLAGRLRQICDSEGVQIEDAALELIARQGTGSVRDSISLLDQVIADPAEVVTLEVAQRLLGAVSGAAVQAVIEALIARDAGAALHALNEALDSGADARQLGGQIVEYLRLLMVAQVGGGAVLDVTAEQRELLMHQTATLPLGGLVKALRVFNTALVELKGGWQPQLPLELAVVESIQALSESAEPPPAPRRTSTQAAHAQTSVRAEVRLGTSLTLSDIQHHWRNIVYAPPDKSDLAYNVLSKMSPLSLQDGVLRLPLPSIYMSQSEVYAQHVREGLQAELGAEVEVQFVPEGEAATLREPSDDIHAELTRRGGKMRVVKKEAE